MFDGNQLGETIVAQVKAFLEREVAPLKAENAELKARIAALESREPEKGEKGDPGEKGEPGQAGANGLDGKDGRGVKELLIDHAGKLIATMDDGEMKKLGRVVGKDGKDGKRGKDGLGFDDLDACVLDDDRTIEFSFRRGDEEKSFTFKWPTMIFRGSYRHGETYEAGDCVNWGGHMWVAEKQTDAKPDEPEKGWRLAVKRGRDGKDAK